MDYTFEVRKFLDGSEIVFRLPDCASIPLDESNTDYQRYLEWLAAGGVPEVIEG
jgi:hypothetical protein